MKKVVPDKETKPLIDLTRKLVAGYLGYHYLLCGIFGYPKPQVKFDSVDDLVMAVYEGRLPCAMSNEVLEEIDKALSMLTSREVTILQRRCGFGNYDQPQTLQQIADDLGLTKGKVRAIEAYAFKKLRHPLRSEKLRDIPNTWADVFGQIDNLKHQLKRLEAESSEFVAHINTEMEKYRHAADMLFPLSKAFIEDPKNPTKVLLGKPLSDFEMSVRAGNCLKLANINTIGELATHTESEMLRIRNLGRHALNELKTILNSVGLNFRMTTPD